MPQDEITALLIARAREGKCVVRLKGGDPYIFGRGGEEAEALAAAKIPFEVVPGVSSIVAAPNYAGIPLTHREHCSSFTVLPATAIRRTRRRRCITSKSPKFPAPRSCSWARKIWRLDQIAHRARDVAGNAGGHHPMGHAGKTKIRFRHAGDDRETGGKKKILAARADRHRRRGEAAREIELVRKRPLFGQRIVVTRRVGTGGGTFRANGSRSWARTSWKCRRSKSRPTETDAIVDALLELNSYDWLVFTSANGVTAFFDIFFKRFQDMRDIGGARIAAVGPATAAKLRELHLQVDLTPDEFTAQKMAEAFAKFEIRREREDVPAARRGGEP
jgi:uroporphyrinogen III methyltransferase / synthase